MNHFHLVYTGKIGSILTELTTDCWWLFCFVDICVCGGMIRVLAPNHPPPSLLLSTITPPFGPSIHDGGRDSELSHMILESLTPLVDSQ